MTGCWKLTITWWRIRSARWLSGAKITCLPVRTPEPDGPRWSIPCWERASCMESIPRNGSPTCWPTSCRPNTTTCALSILRTLASYSQSVGFIQDVVGRVDTLSRGVGTGKLSVMPPCSQLNFKEDNVQPFGTVPLPLGLESLLGQTCSYPQRTFRRPADNGSLLLSGTHKELFLRGSLCGTLKIDDLHSCNPRLPCRAHISASTEVSDGVLA